MTKPHDPTVAYQPSAELQDELGPLLNHRWGCRCTLHGRRLFGAALAAGTAVAALPALAREGVEVGEQSQLSRLVSAGDVEKAAQMQYGKLIADARQQGALAAPDHPQLVRLRTIADRIVPFAKQWNRRAESWQWEINLINSKQVNAFCMPGGKIAFFTAILDDLKLTDDEVAMVMGHEMAHALREHAREQMSKSAATGLLAGVVSNLLGLGNTGNRFIVDLENGKPTVQLQKVLDLMDLLGLEVVVRTKASRSTSSL